MKLTLFHFERPHVYSPLSIRYAYATTLHYYCIVDNLGVWFRRHGSELGWIWPWKRKLNDGRPWHESGLGSFKSLKDNDAFWQEYFEYCDVHREEDFS